MVKWTSWRLWSISSWGSESAAAFSPGAHTLCCCCWTGGQVDSAYSPQSREKRASGVAHLHLAPATRFVRLEHKTSYNCLAVELWVNKGKVPQLKLGELQDKNCKLKSNSVWRLSHVSLINGWQTGFRRGEARTKNSCHVICFRNGVHHRDHSCPDSGGVHSRHGHHHVLLLRGAAEEGEDGLEIFFKDQKSKFSLEQLMKEKTPKRTSSLQLKGLNCWNNGSPCFHRACYRLCRCHSHYYLLE